MRMFRIPDVDLLEQIMKVPLSSNNEESATITFNTGVAQGSITSPQLFNIFTDASMPCYACSQLQNRMRILVLSCRPARIRKGTSNKMRTVINSTI